MTVSSNSTTQSINGTIALTAQLMASDRDIADPFDCLPNDYGPFSVAQKIGVNLLVETGILPCHTPANDQEHAALARAIAYGADLEKLAKFNRTTRQILAILKDADDSTVGDNTPRCTWYDVMMLSATTDIIESNLDRELENDRQQLAAGLLLAVGLHLRGGYFAPHICEHSASVQVGSVVISAWAEISGETQVSWHLLEPEEDAEPYGHRHIILRADLNPAATYPSLVPTS